MEKIMIGYPSGGSVKGAFTKSLLDLQRFELKYPSQDYELVEVNYSEGLYIADNRNQLVKIAQDRKFDWLLQLDGDETFDQILLRILMRTANKDTRPIVVGLYANIGDIRDESVMLVDCIYAEGEDGQYRNLVPPKNLQPFEVDAAGTGIFLTHLSVFDKIQFPWFFETYITPTGREMQFMNEDIAFCRKAREAGYRIWCDPIAEATHWKTLPISPSTLRDILTKAQEFMKQAKA